MKRLLKHCDVLLLEDGVWRTKKNAWLGVDGDTICYLSETEPKERYDEVKDLSGKLVLPGLINCHNHSPMVFLRGIGSDLNLQDWLYQYIFPTEAKWTDHGVRVASELALLEMIACGTTSYSDMYYHSEQTVQAAIEAGIKLNVCRSTQGRPGEAFSDNPDCREGIELFDRWHNAANGRVKVDLCIHAEYTNLPEIIRAYSAVCKEKGAIMQLHLSETRTEQEACVAKYGKTPAELFDSLGTFENPVVAAHCVWVTDSDIELLKARGVSPVHCPSSNMKIGSGFAPVQKMLDRGLNVTIGTDGAASNNNLNLLEELHLAAIIHNGYLHDPTVMNPGSLLKMATVNGARAQGRSDTGELKVGKKADLIAIDFDKPHLIPALDYPAMMVYSVQDSDVCLNMVDGQILYENGEYKTLDAERIKAEARTALRELY